MWGKNNRERRNLKQKELRHKKGISKNHIFDRPLRFSIEQKKEHLKEYREKNKERIRLARKKYKYNKKMAGKLTTETIQRVYEDNIKKYGTLTCYLCYNPIELIKEHLEHKTPLSRGGTNEYNNLDIACSRCNLKKHDKTVEEYLNKQERAL